MTTIEHLKKYGIRPSVQRIAVMSYLLENRTHPTVDDIYVDLVKEIPTLSKTTVYNTLELLVSQGAVLELTIENCKAHYDGCTEPHSHFFCKECKKIYDCQMNEKLLRSLQPDNEFMIESTQLYYIGLCAECKNKN